MAAIADTSGMEAALRRGLRVLGLPDAAAPAMARHGALLLERNQSVNLTALTDPEDVAALHFLDSAALTAPDGRGGTVSGVDFAGKSVVDVGTGAGFPGVPLRLLCPDLHLTLLDAQRKRVAFLREVCAALNLPDAVCVQGRAEDLARPGQPYREAFDIAVSRAVAALPVLAELCLPLVRPGGVFLAMKSIHADGELRDAAGALAVLGGAVERTADYAVPGTDAVHRVIAIRKIRPTPERYPRPFAKIKKQPLRKSDGR